MKTRPVLFPLLIAGLLAPVAAFAGKADVVNVRVDCPEKNRCDFTVTVLHTDEGWDHYADRWQVLGPDGEVLGTRTLLHPHEHEQPFTRSLEGVAIPPDIDHVTLRAHDSVHGDGGRSIGVALPPR